MKKVNISIVPNQSVGNKENLFITKIIALLKKKDDVVQLSIKEIPINYSSFNSFSGSLRLKAMTSGFNVSIKKDTQGNAFVIRTK